MHKKRVKLHFKWKNIAKKAFFVNIVSIQNSKSLNASEVKISRGFF
jgi:hypothetical protein